MAVSLPEGSVQGGANGVESLGNTAGVRGDTITNTALAGVYGVNTEGGRAGVWGQEMDPRTRRAGVLGTRGALSLTDNSSGPGTYGPSFPPDSEGTRASLPLLQPSNRPQT